jgi:hypothetical protein
MNASGATFAAPRQVGRRLVGGLREPKQETRRTEGLPAPARLFERFVNRPRPR